LKFRFDKTYFICFIILFIIEVAIAIFLSNGFIRSTFGDFLVVMLIYSFVKTIFDWKPLKVAIGVLIFAYLIEFTQLFQILKICNLQDHKILATVLGSTFQISDLVSYTIGTITILIIEDRFRK